jgi:hypothetical protein
LDATPRADPVPSIALARFEFNFTSAEAKKHSNNAFYAAVSRILADLPALYAAELSGYFSMMPLVTSNSSSSQMNFAFMVYTLTSSLVHLQTTLDPIMKRLNSIHGLTTSITSQYVPSYLDHHYAFFVADKVGNNRMTVSRLWDRRATEEEQGVARTLRRFSDEFLQRTSVSGPGVQNKSSDGSSLNSAWRHTAYEYVSFLLMFHYHNKL